ncbi:hypothetical protein M1432_01740 [Patescibacteria group bacterium]|nr:hypothetical protein [Patescibacteria group bacterium]
MGPEKLISMYSALGRPLTLVEISRLSDIPIGQAAKAAEVLSENGRIREDNGAYFTPGSGLSEAVRRQADQVLDLKWRKLLGLARWFRFAPFIDFAIVNGSMTVGNVTPLSDFDILIGVRPGRMFTARYFLNFIFGLVHGRRLDDEKGSSPNKLCFNHFVTEPTFEKPPHNIYRRELYRNMVPVYGEREKAERFFGANAWSGANPSMLEDLRYSPAGPNIIGRGLETVLNGRLGDLIERKVLGPIAKRRLGAYIAGKPGDGRTVMSENELEFHFDLRHEKRFQNTEL